MSINKSIKQYTQTLTPESDDALLIQRGNNYFYGEHIDVMMGIQRIVKTFTQAEIKLMSTPVEIVPSAGAGTVIVPLDGTCAFLDYNGTAYATATCVRIKHSGQSNYLMTTSESFLIAGADRYELMKMQTISAGNQLSYVNTALVVDASTLVAGASANAINDGGTVTIDLLYVVKKFA